MLAELYIECPKHGAYASSYDACPICAGEAEGKVFGSNLTRDQWEHAERIYLEAGRY